MFTILVFFVLSIVVGLMFLFFGYPFFRVLLPIWGFFAGIAFGVNGMQSLFGANVISDTFGFAVGLVAGIVLAFLAYTLYSVAVYIFGITVGYILGSGFMVALGFNVGFMSALVGVIAAVALLVVFGMAKMPKIIVMVLTAAGGAMAVITGLFVLFGAIPSLPGALQLTSYMVAGSWFWMIIWVVLAGAGLAFQYMLVQATNEDLNANYNWNMKKSVSKKKKKR